MVVVIVVVVNVVVVARLIFTGGGVIITLSWKIEITLEPNIRSTSDQSAANSSLSVVVQ